MLGNLFLKILIKHIYIKNFGLIEEISISPGGGFIAITGETGAGKSMLLGALSMVFGSRVDSSAIRVGEAKAISEIVFDNIGEELGELLKSNDLDFDDDLIIRREVMQNGKTRAFINDTPVNISLLKDVGNYLIDINAQNTTRTINSGDFQLQLIDYYSGNKEILAEYKNGYRNFMTVRKQLDEAESEFRRLSQEQDFIKFQLEELEKLDYQLGEEKNLEEELKLLENAEDIKKGVFIASGLISDDESGMVVKAKQALQALRGVEKHVAAMKTSADELQQIISALKEIAYELDKVFENTEFSEGRIEKVDERLSAIYGLVKKHHLLNGDELLIKQGNLRQGLSSVDKLADEISRLGKEKRLAFEILEENAKKLSASRQKVISMFEEEVVSNLVNLMMPNARFEVRHSVNNEYSLAGSDEVEYYFSSNKGVEMQPVTKVASGGEVSRLMLVLKSIIGRKNELPTIVFDEIDTGISGETALKVSKLMKEFSKGTQLFAITHLPQIAASANKHFKVFKNEGNDKTISGLSLLDENEKVHEIATMISGNMNSESSMEAAKEMIRYLNV